MVGHTLRCISSWERLLNEARCAAQMPPLPGSYKIGDKVYSAVWSQSTADGDRMVHGHQGEVVGPSRDGKGVLVYFHGTKGPTNCSLNQVRAAGRPRTLVSAALSCAAVGLGGAVRK